MKTGKALCKTTRRDFIGTAALAAGGVFAGHAAGAGRFYRGALLHLGANMWDDFPANPDDLAKSPEEAKTRPNPLKPSGGRTRYCNSLALAAAHGCKSIVFPCISTGIYGYPKEEAARIAVREVGEFLSAKNAKDAKWEGACPHAPNGRARTPAAPQDRGGGRPATSY